MNLLEKLIKKELPLEYKELLEKFNVFLIVQEKGTRKLFYFDPIKVLLEKENIGNGKTIYFFEKLKYLVKESPDRTDIFPQR